MLEISSIISKPVLSQVDANVIGIIKDVYFEYDCKKIAYFLMQGNEDAYLIPFNCVTSFSDAITVVDKTDFRHTSDVDVTDLVANIFDMPVYTQNGDLKGTLQKAEFTLSGKMTKFFAQDFQFAPSLIVKIGNVIVLKSTPKQFKRKKQEIPRPENDYPVYLLDASVQPSAANMQASSIADSESEQTLSQTAIDSNGDHLGRMREVLVTSQNVLLQDAPHGIILSQDSREPMFTKDAFESLIGQNYMSEEDDCHTPTRIICNYDFLLDRTLDTDLYTYGGEIIAKKGTKVTNEILQQARRAGKLVELTINSLKL